MLAHRITDSILAMQRPSTTLIEHHGVREQFAAAGIKAIFNLQMAGEHAFCGPNTLEASGFSYTPQDFMDAGSKFGQLRIQLVCSDNHYSRRGSKLLQLWLAGHDGAGKLRTCTRHCSGYGQFYFAGAQGTQEESFGLTK